VNGRLIFPSARSIVLLTALAALAALCQPLPAKAGTFGPIELVSKSPREQAEVGAEPALSADGRYIAFCAELGGREGIFREELGTDQLAPVAVGPISTHCGANSYASAPSLSADGRYVSFTTTASLVAADTAADTSDVYVADMSTSPPTYELASVVDEPVAVPSEEVGEPEPVRPGSVAAGRVALSADGDRVAFVHEGNVYVRELSAEKTVLISARRDPLTGMTEEAVTGGGAYEPAGAAISGDGSTVAWVGEHLPDQAPMLSDEVAAIQKLEARSAEYHEPLWRRIPSESEPLPPTRRVVGGGDPLAPGCLPSGSTKEPQCQGPYPEVAFQRAEFNEHQGYGWGLKLPQLDRDGDLVALAGDPTEQYDLFVIDMQGGLDRLEAVHQITRWTNPAPKTVPLIQVLTAHPEYFPLLGEIAECAISPDGTRVAFATTRQRFSTAPYTLVTELPSAVGQMAELYELNLENDRIERATPGPGKELSAAVAESPQGVASISFGGGNRFLAFSSGADNLVEGDANERSDAFVLESIPPAPIGTSSISPRPPQSAIQPAWRLTANAYSRPDGRIRIIARVPGRGTLRSSARAQLGGHLKSRQVASGRRRSTGAGTEIFEMKLGRGRQAMAHKPGLVARVHVTFTGSGGRPLHVDLQSRFLVHAKRKGKSGHEKGGSR
jgi:hypothetical protein